MSLIFSACPHDVAKDPEKWNAFNEYLASKNALKCDYEKHTSFDEFAENFSRFDLIYAHPLHAVQLRERKFLPLTKYGNVFDEAVVIASKSMRNTSYKNLQGQPVAYVPGTPSHAAVLIDIANKHPGLSFEQVRRTNYPDVLLAVSQGDASYGIILKSVWDDMIAMKDRVVPIYATSSNELVHVFMLSPKLINSYEAVKAAMTGMQEDIVGKAILARLNCGSLVDFNEENMRQLAQSLSVCGY